MTSSTTELLEAVELLKNLEWSFQGRRCYLCAGCNYPLHGETDFAHNKACPLGAFLDTHAPNRPQGKYPQKAMEASHA